MNCFELAKMTWEEVEASLEKVRLAIIPVGAHEQHGPHMVESCDAVLAEKMAVKLGERLFPYVLIAPTVNMGVSLHHMNFPGTISLKPTTLIALLKDMVSSLYHHGIRQFLFLNSHGGNQSTLDVAVNMIKEEMDVELFYAKTTSSAKKAINKNVKSTLFGHSCEREVSEAFYLAPELIRIEKLQKGDIQEAGRWRQLRPGCALQGFYHYEEMTANGCIGDAQLANYEKGRQIVEEALDTLSSELIKVLKIEEDSIIRSNR
ncbi:creatininase family protein [Siminovitchia sediminis]|uniref:Creatininase family protein n=1 Tax=Siminovitchia sediminis TaxID=1274353 RepID=A0ABW4KGN9_9BACI